jgi:periplasmic protein TonB
MAKEREYVESLEEMVFKGRNQTYGAYILRKKYKKYVTVAMIITLVLLIGAVAYPVIASYISKNKIIREEKTVATEILNAPKEDLPPPPPPPPPPEAMAEKVKFTVPKVVEDTVETGLQTQDDLSAKPVTEAPPAEEDLAPKEEKKQVIEQVAKPEPFTVVEEMPSFPGGEGELYKFISSNIRYPEEAKELGIQGRVFVNFVVEADGSITEVKLIRGIGGGCDEEALRVVRSMPKWVAGKQRGVPVRVYFNLPIKFTLQ